ncbi:HEAT repeat domain-containing protein [Microbulbifer sp. SSSA005]|uniref:HEAT repeat domain-containing protein n=1 Tax=Microbulbifer sp. SSSA005 TaxID=3243378 RepID=UPI00403988D9
MIESAEEFKRLRESEVIDEYTRAAHDQAPTKIWEDVLEKYPKLAFWVAQNKTVPVEILENLAAHNDPKVRGMVARKRKIPESLMLQLAKDEDESVRNALANNGKITEAVLRVLINDSWQVVRERASEKLRALTSKGSGR